MRYLAAGLLMAATLPALADGQATLQSGSGQNHATMEVHWAGSDLRMDFPGQDQAGFMLFKDGKGYMVSNMQGQTVILELAKLKAMAEGMGGGESQAAIASQQASEVTALEPTGETETVAGVEGDVYRMTWTDKGGTSHEDTLVLSDAAAVRELSERFDAYQQSVTGEPDAIATTLADRELGLLRFGERFRLTSLSDASPSPEAFELPEDALTMEEMMRNAISQ
ncbi:hypothetical protein [Halomonas cerina]|uniref:DUF4412 domain-containing protein n=1 Tax=Halomonas cerina TaxID=447424 RepID=A0A839V914_9GAMM|nr:hypothetical protein [Halomonas cerina]MBB3190538.1 hypothetical protein [Halomonas cerina]